jgi:hypothetical protein
MGQRHRCGLSVLAILSLFVVCTAAPLSASAAQALQPAGTTFEFPSSDSVVVASFGFIDDTQVGFFWSVDRGDRVSETFAGPSAVDRAILNVDVVDNVLQFGGHVDWSLEINGITVGSFRVEEGFLGPITLDVSFPTIQGPVYEVTIRVTNEVPGGFGSHTLAYSGSFAHSVELFQTTTPQSTAACKDGGWRNVTDDLGQPFSNQGQCVRFVVAH